MSEQSPNDSSEDRDQDAAKAVGSGSGNSEPKVPIYEPGMIHQLPIDDLHPNPEQPRQFFDVNAQRQLVSSIESIGVIVRIIAHQDSAGRLIIVDGESRWRASKIANLTTISGIIVDGDGKHVSLISNIVRQNLQPMDEAEAIQKLINQEGLGETW